MVLVHNGKVYGRKNKGDDCVNERINLEEKTLAGYTKILSEPMMAWDQIFKFKFGPQILNWEVVTWPAFWIFYLSCVFFLKLIIHLFLTFLL